MKIASLKPRKKKYHALFLYESTYQKLIKLKTQLKNEKKRAFGNDIVEYLIDIKEQTEDLEKKYLDALNQIHDLEKQIIKLVKNNSLQLIQENSIISSSNNSAHIKSRKLIPPPNSKNSIKSPKPLNLSGKNNPKSALLDEMSQIMNGQIIRPSEILKISQPQFANIEES